MWSARSWVVAAAGAIAVLAIAAPRLSGNDEHAAGPQPVRGAAGQPAEIAVETFAVVASPLTESVTATGSLLAAESVTLQAEAAGRVTSIHFEEGSRVRKGDLMVKLNDEELRAMRARALHRRELAVMREQRIEQLIGKGVARQEEFDIASNERKVQDAELALIDAQLAKTQIRAPFTGIVGLRYVSEGAFLTTATAVATLQRTAELKIEFSLPEQYAARVRNGMTLRFSVSGDGTKYDGSVYAVDTQIDTRTRTLSVRARCPNPAGRLLPGNFATIEMQLGTLSDALLIPATAISMGGGDKSVFLLVEGKARRRAITTGVRLEDRVQVLSGLRAGDVIVASGIQQLRDGAPIRNRATLSRAHAPAAPAALT